MTSRCAVLGSPIAHSLSPLIHRLAYAELGLTDWSYGRREVDEAGLGAFLRSCGPEWVGLSCTAPLKRRLLDFGEPSETAALLGAGNTYLFDHEGGRPRVENTDVTGLVAGLVGAGITAARRAVLIGSGATARSSLLALRTVGVDDVVVMARSEGRAHDSLDALADRFGQTLTVVPWGEAPDTGPVDLLVATAPALLDADVADALVRRSRACFDVIYDPYPTALNQAARAAGVVSLDGLDLLVRQALGQLELMTGRRCEAEPLLQAARASVRRRQAPAS